MFQSLLQPSSGCCTRVLIKCKQIAKLLIKATLLYYTVIILCAPYGCKMSVSVLLKTDEIYIVLKNKILCVYVVCFICF